MYDLTADVDLTDLKMTIKQEKFARIYYSTSRKVYSAEQAGYSKKSATKMGSMLLGEHKVRAALRRFLDYEMQHLDLSVPRLLKELRDIATTKFSDIYEYISKGNANSIMNSPRANAAVCSISEIPSKFGITRHIKCHDKIRAISELLDRYEKMKELEGEKNVSKYSIEVTVSTQEGTDDGSTADS